MFHIDEDDGSDAMADGHVGSEKDRDDGRKNGAIAIEVVAYLHRSKD